MQLLTDGETALVMSLIDKLGKNKRERDTLLREKERLEKQEQTRDVLTRLSEVLIKILDCDETSGKVRGELDQLMRFTLRNVGIDPDKLDYFQQIAQFKKIARI